MALLKHQTRVLEILLITQTKKNIQLDWILNHQELVAELQILEFQQLEDHLLSMIELEQTMLV
jgi:hypothetical protein